jgi:methionyl-tRNA formyltransferase
MYMSAGMDEGDIIEIRKTPIDPMETAEELMARLALIAADLAVDTVENIQKGTVTRTPQDASLATYAPMLSRELSPIYWAESAVDIIDKVRGLQPWPCATAVLGGTPFKIFRVEKEEKTTDKTPGTILALTKKGLEVACGDGEVLTVTQLQAEGKKRMPAVDYFRGHPISL